MIRWVIARVINLVIALSVLSELPTRHVNRITACTCIWTRQSHYLDCSVSQMAAPYVVGVDVGGTNTDAVILVGKKVLSSCKRPTTADKTQGVVDAIQGALDALQSSSRDTVIQSTSRVSIGTTHFVNAVVERARDKLSPVAAIRLCGPASRSLPPFVDFPSDLKKLLCGRVYMVEGGLECSGREISPVNQEELKRIAAELLAMTPPLKNVVITGVFSPLDAVEGGQEREAAAILRTVSPDFSCTLSSGVSDCMSSCICCLC